MTIWTAYDPRKFKDAYDVLKNIAAQGRETPRASRRRHQSDERSQQSQKATASGSKGRAGYAENVMEGGLTALSLTFAACLLKLLGSPID